MMTVATANSTLSQTDRLALLSQVAAFSLLPEVELLRLAQDAEPLACELGQALYRAGKAATAVYLIVSGRAREVALNDAGQEVTITARGRGQLCGTHAALTQTPHRQTLRATGDLTVLRLPLATLTSLWQRAPVLHGLLLHHAQEAERRQFLKLTPAFAQLTTEELEQVLACLYVQQFSTGQTIYQADTAGEACYLLRTGKVQLVAGETKISLQPGDVFGTETVLTGEPRAHHAIVREEATVFCLVNADGGRLLAVMLDAVMIVVYLALMFYYNTGLTLAALVFLPGYVVLAWQLTPRLKKKYREAFAKEAEADAFMVETVASIGTIKMTATERRVRWRLEGLMTRALNVHFRSKLLHITGTAASNLLQTLSGVLLLWYGARLVMAGELSVGQLVAFNVLVASLTSPLRGLIELWSELQEASLALERLTEVFDAAPESQPGARLLLPEVRGHVRFSNVTFRYPTRADRNVLQGINLEVQPGQTVALVGRSGAGKTTFANLLLRLQQPNEGRILLDGYDLEQVSLDSLRSQIGVVPQDVCLFSGTIRENIALGDPDAPLAEVVGAARLAGAHEFISELPLGYETKIGERGQSLSGGQKQRLAIARALYKKSGILVFDEATSALDTESERAIQQNLQQILHHRTTFIIAHRLSTVRHADLIVVLDRGVIVETGTHESLLQMRGLYYYLCSQQLEN